METKFQTSFIPKRPIISTDSTIKAHHSVSLFMMIGVLFFILSLAGAGFVIFWKSALTQTLKNYQATLTTNENEFNPTLIDTLRRVNTKIDTSKSLLSKHLAVAGIFDIIGSLTAENVKFKSLDYIAPTAGLSGTPVSSSDTSNFAQINMQGVGTSFSAIAFQSDVFGKSSQYGHGITLKNPVLSGLSLDATGNVSFGFTAMINPTDILYTNSIANASASTPNTPTQ